MATTTTFAIGGMHCAACAVRNERTLRKIPGVLEANVNLGTAGRSAMSEYQRRHENREGRIRERWGRIVNITSVVAEAGNAGQSNYCAAKAGLIGLTKSLAHELASRNVTVNAVAPGFVETDMTAALTQELKKG